MQGHVCVQLMLNFYGSWASFQNPMPLLKQTSLFLQHRVCIQSYQVPWVCFQRECFQTHYLVTRDSKRSLLGHILFWCLMVLRKTHDSLNWTHPPAGLNNLFFFLMFLMLNTLLLWDFFPILSFTVLSFKIKLTLRFVSFSMTAATPNRCHPWIPCSSSLHRPSSAFACPIHTVHVLLQLLLPGSPDSRLPWWVRG